MKTARAALPILVALPLLGGCVVATSSNSNGNGGGSFFFLLIPLFAFVLIARALRGRSRGGSGRVSGSVQRLDEQQSDIDPRMIRAELSVLADDVLRLETDVVLHEAARNDYESAVHRYQVAQAAMEQHSSDGRIDLTRVQRVVDEATWSMSRAKAIVMGYPPPPPPQPLQNPGARGEPAVRMTGDDEPAYLDAPVSFRSGWFGGGGLLGGLMMGSMLGGFGGWTTSEWSSESSPGDPRDGYEDHGDLEG